MPSVREGVQSELQPHHTQQETHRIQTVRLRPLRQRLPEEGGPEEAQRDATRPEMKRNFIFKKKQKNICLGRGHFLEQESLLFPFSARVLRGELIIYLFK